MPSNFLTHSDASRKLIFSIFFALVIILVGYLLLKPGNLSRNKVSELAYAGAGEVEVVHADLSDATLLKAPEGFPEYLPIESQNVTESYKVVFKDHNLTQYTVSFSSMNSRETLWSVYADIMVAQGYEIDESVTKSEQGSMRGFRTDRDLNITINSSGEGSFVTINYVEEK